VHVNGERPDEDLGRWRRDEAAVVQSSGHRTSALNERTRARWGQREKKSKANEMALPSETTWRALPAFDGDAVAGDEPEGREPPPRRPRSFGQLEGMRIEGLLFFPTRLD
jgi:hypothetical protein